MSQKLGNAPKYTFSAVRVIKTKAEARLNAWAGAAVASSLA